MHSVYSLQRLFGPGPEQRFVGALVSQGERDGHQRDDERRPAPECKEERTVRGHQLLGRVIATFGRSKRGVVTASGRHNRDCLHSAGRSTIRRFKYQNFVVFLVGL